MRYRRQKTLKAAFLFLGACFIGGILLHSHTDSARDENRRNRCNGPWCDEDSPVVADGRMPRRPFPTDAIREHIVNDLVRHHEVDRAAEAAAAARAAADAAVDHDHKADLLAAARDAADAAVNHDHEAVDKQLGRDLVGKFNPANPGNILPKKDNDGAKYGRTEASSDITDGDSLDQKGAVQVGKSRCISYNWFKCIGKVHY